MTSRNELGFFSENVAGVFCYLAGVSFPIIYLTLEPYKRNRFVRFHAFQSLIFFAAGLVARIFIVPFIGPRIGTVIEVGFLVVWILLMIKAYQGRMFKLPVVGDLAERYA